MNSIGVVVIGRNEAERLRLCFSSLSTGKIKVYVDSGSTDGSVELARSAGADVVELGDATPFTAARARNTGFERLLAAHPDVESVQFVDGDCELKPGWLDEACRELEQHPGVAIVCGRVRERHRDASVYHRLCDMEWNAATGAAAARSSPRTRRYSWKSLRAAMARAPAA